MSKCRSCQGPIIWAPTATGSRMPLEPHPQGTVVIEDGVAHVTSVPPPEGVDLYVSHFATCPQAGAWRRKDGHGV